jgi:hypothetical protein
MAVGCHLSRLLLSHLKRLLPNTRHPAPPACRIRRGHRYHLRHMWPVGRDLGPDFSIFLVRGLLGPQHTVRSGVHWCVGRLSPPGGSCTESAGDPTPSIYITPTHPDSAPPDNRSYQALSSCQTGPDAVRQERIRGWKGSTQPQKGRNHLRTTHIQVRQSRTYSHQSRTYGRRSHT